MAVNTWTDLTCPSGCDDDLSFASIPTDQNCVLTPDLSQVSDLYIIPTGASDYLDYSGGDPVAVSGTIDNTNTDNTKVKWLVGRGGVEAPEETTYDGPKGATIITNRRYTLSFEVIVKDSRVRDIVRNFQCNPGNFTFRYHTRGGYVFGGENAISVASTNGQLPLGAGDEDNEIGTIIISFDSAAGDPPRHDDPLAS